MRRLSLVGMVLPLAVIAVSGPVLATPPPSLRPSIVVDKAGVKQANGNYLWQYEVFTGRRPSLSHWVLGVCDDVFNSVIGSTVIGGPIEFDTPDPPTGANGIKFNASVVGNTTVIYSFETSKDWTPTNVIVTFKAGTKVTSQTVLGPSCSLNPHDPNPPVTPEPGTLALVSLGGLPLLRTLRRRAE
jgi:MYXO-CTERM domain-containing protein